MAGNQFLTEIDLEFRGNFDEISAQAQAALDKIARSAQEASDSGESVRGLSPAVQEVGRRASAAASNFGPEELRSLQKVFSDFQNSLRQTVPRYTGRDVDVAANAQRLAQQQTESIQRQAQQQQARDSERIAAIQKQKETSGPGSRTDTRKATALEELDRLVAAKTTKVAQSEAPLLKVDEAGKREERTAAREAATGGAGGNGSEPPTSPPAAAAPPPPPRPGQPSPKEIEALLKRFGVDPLEIPEDTDYTRFAYEQAQVRRRNAVGSHLLANSPNYLEGDVRAQTEAAILNARKTESLNNPSTVQAFVGQDTASKDLAAEIDKARSGSQEYADAIIKAAAEANLLSAIMAEARAADDDYNASLLLAATARKREAAAADQALAGDEQYLTATGASAVAKKQLAASEELATQANAEYAAAVRSTVTAAKQRSAVEAEAGASQANISNEARAELARRRTRTGVAAEVQRQITPQDISNEAATRLNDSRQKLAVQYQVLAAQMPRVAAGLAADADIEARIVVLKNAQAKALSEQVASLEGRDATLFQRVRNSFRGGSDTRSAANEQTLGQFVGQHVTSTLGYAIPGIAIGIGFTELERSVKEAEQAQRDIAEVKAEFEGLGQASQFSGFANSIKDVSNSTGLAVTEVSELALAMKGVFGDTSQATIALNGIATAAVAMDLGLKEAQTDLTAISQAFPDLQAKGGAAIGQISNEILHLQDLTGVAAKTLTQGVADAAPSAAQLGIGFQQTAATIAAASQRSGLNPQVIGQTYSKLLDGLSQNMQEIFAVFQQIPSLAPQVQQLAKESPAQQLPQILRDYGKLQSGEQIQIQRTLGINASAVPALNALTQSGQKAQQIAATVAPADRTQQEFNKQIDTLQGHIQRLQQAAANFGVALINGGVGRFFSDAASAAGALLHFLTDINQVIPGIGSAVLAVGAAFLTWQIGSKLFDVMKSVIGSMRDMLGATDATTGAVAANTVAEGANAAALGADSTALGVNTAARAANAAAATAGAGETVLGSGLILPAGVAGAAGETAAAGRGLFGIEALGAGVGGAGLGALGPAVGLGNAIPAALLAGLAGYGAFAGTTKLLDTVFGKPQNVKPAYVADSNLTDFIKNNRDRIEAVAATGTPQQQAQVQKDIKSNNLDVLRLYNQIANQSPAGKIAQTDTITTDLNDYGEKHHQTLQQAAAARQAQNAQVDLLARQSQIELTDWAGVQTGYQAGGIAFSTLLKAATANVTAAQDAYRAQGTGGTQAEFEALQTAIQQRNAILDQQAQQAQQFFASVQQQGSPQAGLAIIASLRTERQLSPQGQQQQAQGLVQAYQQVLQDEANLATSTAQRNAILRQGIQVSAPDLAVINRARASQGLRALASLTIPGQQITPQQTFQASQEAIQASASIAQATAFEDPVKLAQAAIQSAQQQMQAYLASGGKQSDPQFQQLIAQVQNASNQLIDANNAIASAQISLTKAFDTAGGNLIGQAIDDQRLAEQAYAAAHGTAEKLAAQAQLVAANREAVNAINSIATAQAGLATAMASVVGDPGQLVAAAQGVTATAGANVSRIAAADQAIGQNPNQDQNYIQALTQYYQSFQAQVQIRLGAVQAAGDLFAAQAHEDPLAQAAVAYRTAVAKMQAVVASGESTSSNDFKEAQAAAIAASTQYIDQIHQIQAAQVSVSKAYDTAAGDLLGQARDDEAAANVALAAAHGAAARLQAEAQKIAANREMINAVNEMGTALAGLATAMAAATGAPATVIRAAQHAVGVDLANAQRIAAADRALGRNPANDQAYIQALTQYYNDRAAAASTVAQEVIQENETLLFLGKETATQAIARLEAALPQVRGNIAATNQILTEIRQIQNSAGSNLNFDLPTTLLPATLYEARRLERGGYSHVPIVNSPTNNNNIQIIVNPGSPSSVSNAVSKLTAAVGGPQRTGTLGPLLNG